MSKELIEKIRSLARASGKYARPSLHEAADALESQAREIERLNAVGLANEKLTQRIKELKAQPSGVVLPERLDIPHRDEFESADHYAAAVGEANKWNACLDEVARLNQPASGVYSADPLACSGCVSGCFRCRTEPASAGDNPHPVGMLSRGGNEEILFTPIGDPFISDGMQVYASALSANHSEQVREGYVQVPKSMLLEANSLEALVFVGGGITGDDGVPTYIDCVLWVGDLLDDDGKAIHGLHAYCTECEEEGSTTLAEFAAAPSAGSQGGDV